MEMMACPHCGAQNSAKRDYCYECQGDLRSPAKASTQHDYVPTCASCSRALISAPLGRQLTGDQVWCTERDEAVASATVAGDCFSEAFGWRREDILD